MTVTVAQLGARRHYLLPRALDRHGLLSRFHTDLFLKSSSIRQGLQRVARVLRWNGAKSLSSRFDMALDGARVTSYPLFGLKYKLMAHRAKSQTELTRTWLWGGRQFCQLVAECDWGNTNTAYAYTSAAQEIFEAAKSSGIRCVLDHATAPKLYEDSLVNAEIERHPGWVNGPIKDDCAADYTERQKREWQLADTIVCGSTFVQDSIRHLGGPVEKTTVVPLGLGDVPKSYARPRKDSGQPLNVLLVGDDAMRKGVADLVDAIRIAGTDRFKGRVVGNIQITGYGRDQARGVVEFAGGVPRSEMPAQYLWADVFVLPSLSDTFGLVILEAMAHGLPVIATTNTGAPDVLRHETDGFIVPVRAPEVIAQRLIQLADNAELFREMSRNSFQRCQEFNLDSYSARLLKLLGQTQNVAS